MATSLKLEKALKGVIEGEVRFDAGSRALYATDASNYRQIPIGVVIPKNRSDVVQTVQLCREFDAPILSRGAGTSIAGQCCNVAVVLDFSKYMNRILEVNLLEKKARVEPGVILDDLKAAAKFSGLTFGPDPATHSRCTLGGMIGNNSCGIHSIGSGKTVENVDSLEILTFDGHQCRVGATSEDELDSIIRNGGRTGQIYAKLHALQRKYGDLIRQKYPKIPRRISGYNLDQLLPESNFHIARSLVGTEGTCVTVLEATVHLIDDIPNRSMAVVGCPDLETAASLTQEIMKHQPMGLEGLDEYFIRNVKKKGIHNKTVSQFPDGKAWLLIEMGGKSQKDAVERSSQLRDALKKKEKALNIQCFENLEDQHRIWEVRESAFGVTNYVPGERNTFAGWEDSAIPPNHLGPYLKDLRQLTKKYEYDSVFYGHFADGCIHARITFDLKTKKGVQEYREYLNEASDLVLRYGGSLSGEHGDGQTRAHLLPKMFGSELINGFREFKTIWDPEHRMNPGKVVDPYPVDENIRFQFEDKEVPNDLKFSYTEDKGSWADVLLRCVGIGRCRRKGGGTMCPSFMGTREEKHSTRGRARLLFEMMRGEIIRDGWQSQEVKESLDLCLSCKGCKTECPTQVDMATYKAEFMSHYYEKRKRPRSASIFGKISKWAQVASHIPWLANLAVKLPVLGGGIKKWAGIANERSLPEFASETFLQWFSKRNSNIHGGKKVILWPDTVHNYFFPEILKSTVHILEIANFEVIVPQKAYCCSRPLFDYGWIDLAKNWLKELLKSIQDPLQKGIPVLVTEPSCASVFKDELINLFPGDPLAKRLNEQTYLLADFLQKHQLKGLFSGSGQKVVLHGHCHQKALFGTESDGRLLKEIGFDCRILQTGCCGMAGAFGFEAGHYEMSKKIAELDFIPSIQKIPQSTFFISDGFSCREQAAHFGRRKSYHLAQVLEMVLNKQS